MDAREALYEEFGSVCDRERPTLHGIGDTGRRSYCHRHESDHESVDAVLARRVGDGE